MKNGKLFKVLGITLAIVMLLTWIIPASSYDGSKVTLGVITPAGIWDWFSGIGTAFGYFWQGGLLLLFVGGFYGVISKTGALKGAINWFTKIFKGKEKWFLAVSIAFFTIMASLTGIYLPLFIFVPFVIAVILAMGYSKMTALVATVGAIILGNLNLLYNDLMFKTLSIKGAPTIWYGLSLLVITLAISIIYVFRTSDKKKKDEVDADLLLVEKNTDVKVKRNKTWPLVVIVTVMFVLLILGMVPWEGLFKTTIFTDIHQSVMGVKIGNFPIFQNILGYAVAPFGQWGATDVIVLLGLASLVVAIVYKIRAIETLESFVEGVKKYAVIALLVVLVNIVVVFALNSEFYTTVMNGVVGLTEKLNVFLMSVITFFGGALSIDNLYVSNYNVSVLAGIVKTGTSMPLLALLQQTMYGLAMLIAPTSVVLLAGLAYLEIPYTKWLKYIWKLFVTLFVVVLIVLIIATLIINK